MSSTRRLVLIRHASAAPAGTEGDETRNLTDEGFDEARALGMWLKDEGLLGDAVLCSPAARTRQTWAAIDEATGHGVLIAMEQAIYEASVEDLLEVISHAEPDARTLVVVGHAPGIPTLASVLCDRAGDPDALTSLDRGFPPASCAVVEYEGDWSTLAPGVGTLADVRPGTL